MVIGGQNHAQLDRQRCAAEGVKLEVAGTPWEKKISANAISLSCRAHQQNRPTNLREKKGT